MSSLNTVTHQRFWEELRRNPELDIHLNKYFRSRSIPLEKWDELKHTLYCVQSVRFVNFDPERSSFVTWMVNEAKALVRNYLRNNGGSRSPLSGDLTESDVSSEDGVNPYESAVDADFPNSNAIDKLIAIYDALRVYREGVQEFSDFQAVFETLMMYGFEVTDRQIADEIETLTHHKVWAIRQQILSELKSLLISRGVDNSDVTG